MIVQGEYAADAFEITGRDRRVELEFGDNPVFLADQGSRDRIRVRRLAVSLGFKSFGRTGRGIRNRFDWIRKKLEQPIPSWRGHGMSPGTYTIAPLAKIELKSVENLLE